VPSLAHVLLVNIGIYLNDAKYCVHVLVFILSVRCYQFLSVECQTRQHNSFFCLFSSLVMLLHSIFYHVIPDDQGNPQDDQGNPP